MNHNRYRQLLLLLAALILPALAIVALDGRDYREIVTGIGRLQSSMWTKDSRAIIFGKSEDGENWQVMRISAEGGMPVFTGLEVKGVLGQQAIGFSPDGKRIIFSGASYSISTK